ncbi:hypothetical protein TYRP_005128, partial [Tyrophagus putrescentiae]
STNEVGSEIAAAAVPATSTEIEAAPAAEAATPGYLHCDDERSNSKYIRCLYCKSLYLKPNISSLVDLEKTLPKVEGAHEPEPISKFWSVEDMFHFENCSFSKEVEGVKYLSCCECDIGPVGYQDLESKVCYVATERVAYTDE